MPGGIGRAFSVAIAAQFQALGMLGLAWFAGDWLNKKYPQDFNWYIVTFLLCVVMIAQTFYVMLRHFMRVEKSAEKAASSQTKPDRKEI